MEPYSREWWRAEYAGRNMTALLSCVREGEPAVLDHGMRAANAINAADALVARVFEPDLEAVFGTPNLDARKLAAANAKLRAACEAALEWFVADAFQTPEETLEVTKRLRAALTESSE